MARETITDIKLTGENFQSVLPTYEVDYEYCGFKLSDEMNMHPAEAADTAVVKSFIREVSEFSAEEAENLVITAVKMLKSNRRVS